MKPMLADKCKDVNSLQYPLLATPKLDGIRCLKLDGRAVSRNLKPIPSPFIREFIETHFPDGVDGEIIIPGAKFNKTTSAVMTQTTTEAAKQFEFWVFDFVYNGKYDVAYTHRMDNLRAVPNTNHMNKILPVTIDDAQGLQAYEEECIQAGFEGAMVRSPGGPYKFGRSTAREGYLLKIKRFEDHEAVVVGFEERMHNDNIATTDQLGHTKRSSHKANMIPADTLGALVVKDVQTDTIFNIGSGFDDAMRKQIWQDKGRYLNTIVKYKSQPFGRVLLPRFPIFLGFRAAGDIS